MRTTNLTLGLAIEAATRGYLVKSKSDTNITLVVKDGYLYLHKDSGKDINLFKSSLFATTDVTDWYIVGDDRSWLNE